MKLVSSSPPARGRWQGTRQIVLYNWPFYFSALAFGALGVYVALRLSGALAALAWAVVGLLLFWTAASLLASYLIYDRSELCGWQWVARLFPTPPAAWVNLHAGLDESSPTLCALFPDSRFVVLDFYDPATMTEASIQRARKYARPLLALRAEPTELPLGDGEWEAAFLLLAAHEIRDPATRLRFFRELRRVLAPQGHILLAEHLRDGANFLAFGPGFLHFLPRAEWLRLATETGFTVEKEFSITPFVRVFFLERAA